jgi:oxygen-independent coproporphyrinogen-3 oxidase
LCTFCGCHKHITKRHIVESPYVKAVLAEWASYRALFDGAPRIKELHLGGGTPTFFSPDHLRDLLEGLFAHAELCDSPLLSFEAHPNNTTRAHLEVLHSLGFKRNSFGIQDYDPVVQKAINRIQSFEDVKRVTDESREVGYTSVSHDLVFGLPHQSLEAMAHTIDKTAELKPDRIAFYSYAHVPWIKGTGQRGYDEKDLPSNEGKRNLYEMGKRRFLELGYEEIGMDHFALPSDDLARAFYDGSLHRNFMGYTSGKTQLMVGLGMSAISDSWGGFAQNVKTVAEYEAQAMKGEIPVFRGHMLHKEDLLVRKHILNLMCQFNTSFEDPADRFPELEECLAKLEEMESDGLVVRKGWRLRVTDKGRPFVRNVCMALDLRLLRKAPTTRVFSMTV